MFRSGTSVTVLGVARVAHEVNRAYCESLGDASQPIWDDAPDWQVDSCVDGVRFHLDNPSAGPEASHDKWLEGKRVDGWAYGETKEPDKKLHPCMVPFDELPKEQQIKDWLFRGVVHAHMD